MRLAIAVIALATLTSCGNRSSCQDQAAVGYPEMRGMAQTTLAGLDYSIDRGDVCAETGEPRTAIDAVVEEWNSRRDAVQYFRAAGWDRSENNTFMSPDGAYWVGLGVGRDAGGPRWVTAQFFEGAD